MRQHAYARIAVISESASQFDGSPLVRTWVVVKLNRFCDMQTKSVKAAGAPVCSGWRDWKSGSSKNALGV